MTFVKSFIVSSLILGTLGSTLMVPLIYLDFNLRRDYIADFLCIKKEEPITVCGGNCFLNNQLQKANEQQTEETTIQPFPGIFFFSQLSGKLSLKLPGLIYRQKFTIPASGELINSFIPSIFHPPQI